VTARSLCNWKNLDPAQQVAVPGRPRTPKDVLEAARDLVRGELERQGWDCGEGPISRALGGQIPLARVRRVLRELKAERRARRRQQRAAARVSTSVQARDAVWSMDATHLGRDAVGRAVQAEVLREVASTRTIEISVGPAATGKEVCAILDDAARHRMGYPLVVQTDNGGAYVSKEVREWCSEHGVLHLLSLPHTPQHNGASENGMYGLKLGAALGKGARVLNIEHARARLQAARDRIDGNRLRKTRGWKTAVQADADMPHWSTLVGRQELLHKTSCAIRKALIHCEGSRARRRAVREAILSTLQSFSVIQRTRGGRPWTAHNAESDL